MSITDNTREGRPYARVVRWVVRRAVSRLPDWVSAGEVERVAWAAYEGFMRSYCPVDQGDTERYLYIAVRRAVIDEIRALDPLPRGMRAVLSRIAPVRDSMALEIGRAPTPEEIASRTGDAVEEVRSALEAHVAAVGERAYNDAIATPVALDQADPIYVSELRAQVAQELARLKPLHRIIVQRGMLEGATMTEIARDVGLTSARVGQLRDEALRKLSHSPALRELMHAR